MSVIGTSNIWPAMIVRKSSKKRYSPRPNVQFYVKLNNQSICMIYKIRSQIFISLLNLLLLDKRIY